MKKIKTALFGKSNAILTNDENEVLAIISCGKNKDITKKVCLAIKEEYISEKVVIAEANGIFDNQSPFSFTVNLTDEDGDLDIRDFTLKICATY